MYCVYKIPPEATDVWAKDVTRRRGYRKAHTHFPVGHFLVTTKIVTLRCCRRRSAPVAVLRSTW